MKSILQFVSGLVLWLAGQADLLHFLPPAVRSVVQTLAVAVAALGLRNATAVSVPDAVQHALAQLGSGWKTLAGVLTLALGALLSPDGMALLSPAVAHVVQIVGTVLAAVGLYHAKTAGT